MTNRANQGIEKYREDSQKDMAALRLQLKKAELEAKAQKTAAEAKEKENKELMEICDGLIKQLGEAT